VFLQVICTLACVSLEGFYLWSLLRGKHLGSIVNKMRKFSFFCGFLCHHKISSKGNRWSGFGSAFRPLANDRILVRSFVEICHLKLFPMNALMIIFFKTLFIRRALLNLIFNYAPISFLEIHQLFSFRGISHWILLWQPFAHHRFLFEWLSFRSLGFFQLCIKMDFAILLMVETS